MTLTLAAAPSAVRTSVFAAYSSYMRSVRMARFTADVADLIGAEPGVRLRETPGGWQVLTVNGYVPVRDGDYIANYATGDRYTGVLSAAEVHERYTQELAL